MSDARNGDGRRPAGSIVTSGAPRVICSCKLWRDICTCKSAMQPRRRTAEPRSSDAAEHQGALDLLDGLGDLDAAGAGLGAVEGGPAAPDALGVRQDLQPFLAAFVARVENEPVGVDNCRGADVSVLGPVHRAGRGARRAEDALGGVVEPFAVLLRLDILPGRLVAMGDQERLDR